MIIDRSAVTTVSLAPLRGADGGGRYSGGIVAGGSSTTRLPLCHPSGIFETEAYALVASNISELSCRLLVRAFLIWGLVFVSPLPGLVFFVLEPV